MKKCIPWCAISRSATATCRKARFAATRTSRCAGGRGEVRHARRDQEPQLVPLRREGHQLRGRAPDRCHRSRRQGRAGDAPVRSGQGRDALDADEGRGERLPLLPRPRSAAARRIGRVHRGGALAVCRSCRTRRRRGSDAVWAVGLRRGRAQREPRAGSLLRGSRAGVRLRAQARRELGHGGAGRRAQSAMASEIGASRLSAAQLSGLLQRIADATPSREDRQGSVRGDVGQRAAMPMRSSRRRASGRSRTVERSSGSSTRSSPRNPGQLADYRAGKDKLFGFFVGQAMKATQGKGQPAQLNAASQEEARPGRLNERASRAAPLASLMHRPHCRAMSHDANHQPDEVRRFIIENLPLRGHWVRLGARGARFASIATTPPARASFWARPSAPRCCSPRPSSFAAR